MSPFRDRREVTTKLIFLVALEPTTSFSPDLFSPPLVSLELSKESELFKIIASYEPELFNAFKLLTSAYLIESREEQLSLETINIIIIEVNGRMESHRPSIN